MTSLIPVEVPVRYAKWFRRHRAWPVQVEVGERSVRVLGGQAYGMRKMGARHVLYREMGCEVLPMGEISKQGVWRPLSDAARHDLGAIRAALFSVSYPAPLAYEMGNRDLVHPGECFNKHPSGMIRKTHYSVSDEEKRCVICKEPFE